MPCRFFITMPRLSVILTEQQHRAIRIKAAEIGLSQTEIARRFLLAWLDEDMPLPLHSGDVWQYDADGYSVDHWNSE